MGEASQHQHLTEPACIADFTLSVVSNPRLKSSGCGVLFEEAFEGDVVWKAVSTGSGNVGGVVEMSGVLNFDCDSH